jgi:hypothetical protein
MPIRACSICTSEPETRLAVEAQHRAKRRYSDIAADSGFSKTALWRHMTRHLPKTVLEKSKCFMQGDSLLITYADDSPETIERLIEARSKQISGQLWLIKIEYEPAISKESVDAHHAHTERIFQSKTSAVETEGETSEETIQG